MGEGHTTSHSWAGEVGMSWNTLEFAEVTDVSNKGGTKRTDFLVPAWSSYHQASFPGETENLRYSLSPPC